MPSSDYNLEIGAILNTENLEQTLKDEKARLEKTDSTKIKWKIDTDNFIDAIKVVKQFNSEVGKIKQVKIFDSETGNELASNLTKVSEKLQVVDKETKQYTNDLGQLVTQVKTVDEAGQTLVTETTKYVTAQGQQVQSTKTLIEENGKLVQVGKEVVETNQMLAESTTTTTQGFGKITDTINGITNSYNGLITTTTKVNSNGQTVITKVSEYINKAGQAVRVTETLDAEGNHIATTQRQISSATDKTNKSIKDFSNNAKQASSSTNTLNWSLTDAFRRLANFYLASLPIRAFQTAITDAVQVVKDFDSAITEMGKVTDYSGEKLKAYTRDLAELGTEVARTQTEMTEAATGWLKAGYSEEDAALLSKYSALLQNTADEEISAADATSILVSQLKAYHMEAEEAIKVTDIINAVSAQQAVSSADISQGLTVASAAMATFGNSIEETTALLTAGTTIFQGRSSQVARGLNMIATRVAKNEEELAKYGVSINDANGELRSTYDILVDLAPAWNNMSKAEQVALGNTLAGTNQYKILAAIMSQMDVAVETYDQALNSSGETMKQNAVYMESLEAKVTALKAEFEKLVISKGGLQDFAKGLVEIGTSIVQFINKAGGLPSILITITSLLVAINAIKIYAWLKNVYGGLQTLITAIPRAITAWQLYLGKVEGVAAGVVSANTAMEASIPVIGLVAAALGILVSGVIAYNKSLEEQQEKIKENILAFSDEYKALEETQTKLKDEHISREELNSIIDSNLDEYEAERLKLLDLNEAREETIRLIEEEKKAKAQELIDTGQGTYEDSLERIKNGYEEFDKFFISRDKAQRFNKQASMAGMFTADSAKEQIDALKRYKIELIDYRGTLEKGSSTYEKYTDEIKRTEAALTSIQEAFNEDNKVVRLFNEALNLLGKHYDETSGVIEEGAKRSYIAEEEQRKGLEKLSQSNKKSTEELEELKKQYNITEDAIFDYIEAHQEENLSYADAIEAIANETEAQGKLVLSTEELNKAYKESLTSTKDLVSSISSVASALEEQEKNGSLAVKTQLDLIESGYGAALMYDKETGACKLDEEAVKELVKAKLEMQIANLNIERSKVVEQLERERLQAISTAEGFLALAKAKNLANQSALDWSGKEGGRNIADPSKSTSGYGGNFAYLNDSIQESQNLLASYDKEIEALQGSLDALKDKGVKAFGSVGNAAKGAGKKTKDAADEAKKALEETKKQYETVIKWITKQYDKKIDAIKKSKDEAVKAIEKEIKALEKEKDTILDGIEKETDALEKEKDARKKYWDDQIDALKKANQEKKDALELQEKLDALEKARNTKVKIYKEGQGFVYDVDQTAVAEAQKNLDEFLSEQAYEDELARLEALRDAELDNYEKRIDALNDYKDKVSKSYEEQLDALKAHKEALEEQYDAEIEIYQNYKQQFEDMVNAYQEEQDKLLFEQLTGIKAESDNWMTRLDNLAEFVRKYNELQKQLNTGNTGVSNNASMKSGSTSGSGTPQNNAHRDVVKKTVDANNSTRVGYVPTSVTKAISEQQKVKDTSGVVYLHANGVGSIKDDELAIVGENPNQEIVIGSKLNNGELMSLNKGSGVVNADSSSTLAGMLNQVGKFGSSGFGSGNGTLNSNINNDTLTINGVTIQGSNIKDPETFVNGLLNLKAEALQRAYKHR